MKKEQKKILKKEFDNEFDNELEKLIRKYLNKKLQPIIIIDILKMHKDSLFIAIKKELEKNEKNNVLWKVHCLFRTN